MTKATNEKATYEDASDEAISQSPRTIYFPNEKQAPPQNQVT